MQRNFPILREQSEPVPAQVIDSCLNGVFYDGARAIVATLFYSDYTRSHNASTIADAFVEVQGEEPVQYLDPGRVAQYCKIGLGGSAEVVVPTAWGKSGAEIAWGASPTHYMAKLALAGFTTDWGLLYPEWSLRKIYGKGRRAPELRHKICQTILSSEDTLSTCALATMSKEPDGRIRDNVKELIRVGILEDQAIDSDERKFLVKDNRLRPRGGRDFSQYKPETKALYNALESIGRGTILTQSELLNRAEKAGPGIDRAALRKAIQSAFSSGGATFPGLEPMSTRQKGKGTTELAIAPQALEPITVLCYGIRQISKGKNLKAYAEIGIELLDRPADIRTLLAKDHTA